MKKLFYLISILMSLLFAVPSFAAWTCTAVIDEAASWSLPKGAWQAVYRVQLTCDSDGTDPAEFLLSSLLSTQDLNSIKGGVLYKVHTGPGTTAPEDAFTVALDGDLGEDWLTITTTSAATKFEEWDGENHVVWDIQIDIADIGDSGEDVIVYFTIIK